jgi:3-methyladenine DNA glycosylase AlkD
MNQDVHSILEQLRELANPEKVKFKQQKFGIAANNALGIYQKDLNLLAKAIGQNNCLALELYETDIYEARLLVSKIYDPISITDQQMERWVSEFENWEICDSFCMGFFVNSELALQKTNCWSLDSREFVKRAAFAMMASYGFAHKNAENEIFESFLIPIEREATDHRIYVKKAVNWALRSIGKRNCDLRAKAIDVAEAILLIDNKSAKWVASNALKELNRSDLNLLDYPRSTYRPA